MPKKRKKPEDSRRIEDSLLFQVRFVAVLRLVVATGVLTIVALTSGIIWLIAAGFVLGLGAGGSLIMSWRLDPERLKKGGWRW